MNNTTTKHLEACTRVFKNYDLTCPRCLELKNGSAARNGWQKAYYARKGREEAYTRNAIRTHFASEEHKKEIVCTAFDY